MSVYLIVNHGKTVDVLDGQTSMQNAVIQIIKDQGKATLTIERRERISVDELMELHTKYCSSSNDVPARKEEEIEQVEEKEPIKVTQEAMNKATVQQTIYDYIDNVPDAAADEDPFADAVPGAKAEKTPTGLVDNVDEKKAALRARILSKRGTGG
jgi:hypothetical protein